MVEEEEGKEILSLSTVDKCLINMEELEMKVNEVLLSQRAGTDDDKKQIDMTDFFPVEIVK